MAIIAGLEAIDWVADTLRADATLDSLATGGVWLGTVPRYGDSREIKTPAVVIMHQETLPRQTIQDDSLFYRVNLNVKVVCLQRELGTAVTALGRIKTLLHQQSGSSELGTIWRCSELSETAITHEPFQGIFYHHIGINFELILKET